MTERRRSMPTEPGADRDTGGAHRTVVSRLRDPSLELFGGPGDDKPLPAVPVPAYTGRHRASDA